MSSALAIAGVTAVLRDLLNDGFINHSVSGAIGGNIDVSSLPPDRVVSSNGTENTQLNLFLHQVTFNSGWRNHGLPSRDGSGQHRLSNPPLALDLHYILSAYSADELGGEILMGYAMQLLHNTPVLDRKAITTALNPSPSVEGTLPPALRALAECGLADQVEQIKLVPEILSMDDMSKLWTATQSNFRPTAAYLATVVLIESSNAARPTLPVLSREIVVEPSLLPPFPTIDSVAPTNGLPAATVGSTVKITGHHLDGTNRIVVFTNARFEIAQEVLVESADSSSNLEVIVPNVPVGLYQIAVHLLRPNETELRTSNQSAIVLGPEITTPLPMTVARNGSNNATITLTCTPEVRLGQHVSLLLGNAEILAEPWLANTSTFTFVQEEAPIGDHLVRLRVDGIDSPLIDHMATPPIFFNNRITIT